VSVSFVLNGLHVQTETDELTLLEVLRDQYRVRSVKDGCSPQGQCGCCTVLVDGAPRVSCVTPVRRVEGRSIVTVEGLDPDVRDAWGDAFCSTGASQCGFCTPGIVLRLEGLRAKGVGEGQERPAVERALAAHLCRCTGWRTIPEAYVAFASSGARSPSSRGPRDLDAASRRATLEGGAPQRVDPQVALGEGGFADDHAPADALVAVPDGAGGWAVGSSLAEARVTAGKVQGRRTTAESRPPIDVPPGDGDRTLQTSWVEPAYLETDASWCEPGGEPASPLANGGAFGGKADSIVMAAARSLADQHGRAVRVLLSREDSVRLGPKRPPLAAGVRADGSGQVRVARTAGAADAIRSLAPALVVEEVDIPGPRTSTALRGAGWVEAAVLLASLSGDPGDPVAITAPNGAWAEVTAEVTGALRVRVACGDPLDDVVLRSYCVGAAHMALGWVTSESIAVDDAGEVHDLTIRSFGIRRASEMPEVDVEIVPGPPPGRTSDEPVNGSDAVFAAVAAAVWMRQGCPPSWATRLPRPV
jgi:aerobic-type carbon monoxide dehydrogenase small subunit (CoxS/CutS family)